MEIELVTALLAKQITLLLLTLINVTENYIQRHDVARFFNLMHIFGHSIHGIYTKLY